MKQSNNEKHIHFIGIAGKAMASIAKAFRDAGWQVTGSEGSKVYPPMSTYLKKNKIKYYCGFDANKVGHPNEIVISNAFYSDTHPELVYARENNITYQHFPKLLEKYLIKKKSIVVAGTFAKTTISAMLTWAFMNWGKKPAYLTASVPINFPDGCSLGGPKTNWSIVEGDEYPSASPWDFSPKFNYYHPKYLILTSAEWDHLEIFRKEKDYVAAFDKLVKRVPTKGLIVANLDGGNIKKILTNAKSKIIYYSRKKPSSQILKQQTVYYAHDYSVKNAITKFKVSKNNQLLSEFTTQLIGEFNIENWLSVIALSNQLNIPINTIKKSIDTFKGVKKRLEIKAKIKGATIIDDYAHSPSKAREAVKAVTTNFPNSRLMLIFAPNQGNRIGDNFKAYDYIFQDAYKVYIPLLDTYKPKKNLKILTGKELTSYLKKTHKNIRYQPNDNKLIQNLSKQLKPGDIVAFLSHSNIRGMMEKLIKHISY